MHMWNTRGEARLKMGFTCDKWMLNTNGFYGLHWVQMKPRSHGRGEVMK